MRRGGAAKGGERGRFREKFREGDRDCCVSFVFLFVIFGAYVIRGKGGLNRNNGFRVILCG